MSKEGTNAGGGLREKIEPRSTARNDKPVQAKVITEASLHENKESPTLLARKIIKLPA